MAHAYTTTQGGDPNLNSDQAASPYYDGGAQSAWASHPTTSGDTVAILTGHAISDAGAAGFVCGAITGTGTASLNLPGTNAITSITNTAAAGNLTLGPTTFAGVCNWSGGVGVTTFNGALTGATTITTGTRNVNANIACTADVDTAGKAVTVANNVTISGLTSGPTYVGNWTVGSGVTHQVNSASAINVIFSGGNNSFNGTQANHVTFANAGAGALNLIFRDAATSIHDWIDAPGTIEFGYSNLGTMSNCATNGALDVRTYGIIASRSFAKNVTYAGGSLGPLYADDLVIGYKRDGSANAAATGIPAGGSVFIRNGIINATAQFALSALQPVQINNFGHVDPSICPGGSALETANNATQPGIGYKNSGSSLGTFTRSTALPKSGETYELHETPASAVTATLPLKSRISIPIITGDKSVVFSGPVARFLIASTTPATLNGDPEGAWVTPVTHTPTMTNISLSRTAATTDGSGVIATGAGLNGVVTDGDEICITAGSAGVVLGYTTVASHDDTHITPTAAIGNGLTGVAFFVPHWYTETVTTGVVGGTAAKGEIGFDMLCTSYTAGGQLVRGKHTGTVVHADDSTTTYPVSFQNWVDGHPVVDAPTYVAPAKIYAGTPNDFGTALLRASNITDAGAPGVNLSAGILASGSTVDDVVGSLAASGGGAPVFGGHVTRRA